MVAKKQSNDEYYSHDTRIALLEQSITHIHEMLIRFEKNLNHRFDLIDERFDKIDHRFEKVDQRFEKVDHRFEKLDQEMKEFRSEIEHRLNTNLAWILSLLFSVAGGIIGAMGHGFKWF